MSTTSDRSGSGSPAPDMRTRIRQEATRLFAQRGYDAVPLQELAECVGIRKPSLLHHFPSKEHLRQAVLDDLMVHWNEMVPALLHSFMTTEDRLEAAVLAVQEFFRVEPNRARLLMRESLDRPDEVAERMMGYVSPWLEVVSAFIEEDKRRGDADPAVEPRAYVVHLMVMIVCVTGLQTMLGTALSDRENTDEQLRRETLRLLRAGLTGRRHPAP